MPDPASQAAASPQPDPPDPCAGEGWDDVPSLARADGEIQALYAVVTRPDGALSRSLAGSERLHLRVLAEPDARPPTLFLDLDGRGAGAWTHGSSVSAAAWDLRIDREGIHRHEGPSHEWAWTRLPTDGHLRWSADTGELLACLPTELLGGELRVGLGVAAGGDWLPRAFLPGIPFPPAREVGGAPVRAPERLAIAYGYRPWVVRDCAETAPSTMACASRVYGAFRHVVLGGGLEDPQHPSHDGTRRLVRQLRLDHPDQEVWGYVSMRRLAGREHTVDDVAARARAWRAVGVTGVFLDEADLCRAGDGTCTADGITRASQTAAIESIHALGMPVFANGFSAPDVLHPFDGIPTALGPGVGDRPADMYLLENPTVAAGEWRTGIEADATIARMQAAVVGAATLGVRLAAVDTAADRVADDGASPAYVAGWWRAVQAGAEAYGFTNAVYSATDELGSNLPILSPPVAPEELASLAFETTTLRVSEGGRRLSRDVVDCRGRDVGAVVTRVTGSDGAVSGGLLLREDRPPCP